MAIVLTILKTIGKFFRDADIFLLAVSVISAIYGIVLISSVTANFETGGFVTTQITALMLGGILFVFFSYVDVDIFAERSRFLYIFSMLFLLTLRFWGVEGDTGNRAWLRFGETGVQPAEVVKVTFIIIIARILANHKEEKTLNSFVSLLQVLFIFGSIFAMIIWVSSDLGSSLVFFFILLVMLYIAGVKLRWFALGFAAIAALSPLLFNFLTPKQQERIMAPFFPEEYDATRQGVLWQTNQSIRAITNGEFLGQGLGNGEVTQSNIIPHQETDFIFSAAGEELGFVGCLVIIALLSIIIIRCFYIGINSNSPIGLLVCSGVAGMFIAQSVENIGMCLGILPVVGITLPFFSYGGSSMVTCMAAIGLVSGVKMRPKPQRFRGM